MDYNKVEKYLKKNHAYIDVGKNNCFLDLSIMDPDIQGKKIFLTGENHGVRSNVGLRMKFLKYFKEKTDFTYYLCELAHSISYFLNIFLQTGDKDILYRAYEPLLGTDAWNKDDYKHWLDLYEFNKGLADHRKIKVLGIDIDHQLKSPYIYMDHILNKKGILGRLNPNQRPDYLQDLRSIMEKFKSLVERDFKISHIKVKKLYKKLNIHLDKHDTIYRKYLGEEYIPFRLTCKNLLNGYLVYSGNNFNSIRDKKIYNNFKVLGDKLAGAKFFGQWGLSHIFQRPSLNVRWFGAALSQDPAYRGKILSIAYAYNNCQYLYPTLRRDYISSISTLNKEIGVFDQFLKDRPAIFKLKGDNSPFSKDLIWPFSHIFPNKGVTSDYFQYLVIIQASEAVGVFNINTKESGC